MAKVGKIIFWIIIAIVLILAVFLILYNPSRTQAVPCDNLPEGCGSGGSTQYNLNVSKFGNGTGSVTSSPAGIICPGSCVQDSANFGVDVEVTLTAVADSDSVFAGWSDDCAGAANCTVTILGDMSVTATFNLISPPPPPPSQTNISNNTLQFWAWNDTVGWFDFYNTLSVMVQDTKISGYASSSNGDLSLDCATTRNGNVCGVSNYGICNGSGPHNSDGTCPLGLGNGILSGFAWNDKIGWVSFNCDESSYGGSNQCPISNYKVQISQNEDGVFSGWAWNDTVGWISFNCHDTSDNCVKSQYQVRTTWSPTSTTGLLESSIFDTQQKNGAILNGIIWKGTQPTGTCVKFQIAVSNNSAGPWNYYGPDHSSTAYFGGSCSGSNQVINIGGSDRTWVNNVRYLRYKVFLVSDLLSRYSPEINNIILNWSK
ncbi:MAG: hypothetical protein AAB432_01755 [Patescibacteria group bacterium]